MAVTYEQLQAMALALPEAVEEPLWGELGFRVRGRLFATAVLLPRMASVKATLEVQERLVAHRPAVYQVGCHTGCHTSTVGWLQVALSRAKAHDLHELVVEAWRLAAPAALDEAHDLAAPPGRRRWR
jgi:hypothetical protein